ncbi:hypothetical protein FNF27_06517 [Cafeteria roenbergensis]|uniref:galactosylceramidase n=2 Tax=Cafeteria roenbergensis TaxID=33653 RepID=A0A5A8DZ86_CAFRO|nr:hypothetical protein FNF27_06517 [Cafeteria roenbergensis]
MRSVALATAVACAVCSVSASLVMLNSTATDRTLVGFGGLSGGGATSRLLPSYDDDTKAEILDYLFKPNYGASLHILKVEIGGDAQSTDGTEPSHQHTEDDLNCDRGYEWYLLKEAKARNPDILTYGLSWAWPAWTGNFTDSPWNAPAKAANYTLNWLRCARDSHSLDIDYVGSWNERSYSADYLKLLRRELDSNGFPSTRIVAPDSNWDIAGEMLTDPELMDAVDIVGAHYPGMTSSSDAIKTGKLLAASEDDSTFGDNIGTGCWARLLNRNWVQGRMSATIMWNLLASYYPGLPWMGTSFMWATQPWSGHYQVKSAVYVTAHWTQFTRPGWSYLAVDSTGGSGFFAKGGTYASLVENADGTGHFSVVMEKIHHDRSKCVRPGLPEYSVEQESVTFRLTGPAAATAAAQGKLALWTSVLRYNGQESTLFEQQAPIPVARAPDGSVNFTVTVPVDGVITVSTMLTGPAKGGVAMPPSAAPFPVPYSDDFNDYPLHSEPSYFADQAGSWEVLDSRDPAHGLAMRQMVPQKPICWAGDYAPVSVFGETTWTDVNHSVDFMIDPESSATAAASIGARVTGTTRPNGVFVSVGLDGTWTAYYNLGDGKSAAQGKLPVDVKPSQWHNLALAITGSRASAWLDGIALFENMDVSTCNCPSGWTAVGTGWTYEFVWFDNYAVNSATNAGVLCAPAASGQSAILEGTSTAFDANFRYRYSFQQGSLTLISNPSLCLGVSGKDPSSGYPNVALVACDPQDASQAWDLQLNSTTTQFVNGFENKGYCMDVTGQASWAGANVELYECNGGDNQKFVLDEDGRIVNTGYVEPKKAVGACSAIPM